MRQCQRACAMVAYKLKQTSPLLQVETKGAIWHKHLQLTCTTSAACDVEVRVHMEEKQEIK